VLVDYKHDEFASTFLTYYPQTFTHIPAMGDDAGIYQPGARPCFITKRADVPEYSDTEDNVRRGPETVCPTKGQPAFTGRQALYNSGYIPWQGTGANEFVVKIAKDATPGTYKYFCNYHWTFMNGTVRIVPESKTIPSSNAVNREALKQIRADARKPLAAARKAVEKYGRPGTVALAGTDDSGEEDQRYVGVNEFFPSKLHGKVGQPITLSFIGVLSHTISFNVPGYFPVFTVGTNGNVHWDKRAQDPAQWTVPKAESSGDHESKPRAVDVGKWDGKGGFHSSGLLNEGDTFTVTFTKPGTYPYACVVHPPMIGQVVVTA
jgi:plastocyanin